MIGTLLGSCLQSMLLAALSPLYWGLAGLVYYQYRSQFQKETARRLWLRSVGEGMAAGWTAMMMTAGLGIIIEPDPVFLLLGPAAWVLSLFHKRFFCIAYGAALVISVCWVTKYSVQTAPLTALIGILHMLEGVLVWRNGGSAKMRKIVQNGDKLRSIKMFARAWPVAIGVMIPAEEMVGNAMPFWWPLLGGADFVSAKMMGLAATLGYGEVVGEMGKDRRSGRRIAGYGVGLLVTSLIFAETGWAEAIPVVFMVLGHEWIGRNL